MLGTLTEYRYGGLAAEFSIDGVVLYLQAYFKQAAGTGKPVG